MLWLTPVTPFPHYDMQRATWKNGTSTHLIGVHHLVASTLWTRSVAKLSIFQLSTCSEEHIQRKIKLLTQEARQKYAKGDKKGW